MPRSAIERIRETIRLSQYDMTAHASEEMAEDSLEVVDIEQAILTGQVVRTEKYDPRGAKYSIEGTATDGLTRVGVVGRFAAGDRFLIITVYEITES